jgi:hypothetical protein
VQVQEFHLLTARNECPVGRRRPERPTAIATQTSPQALALWSSEQHQSLSQLRCRPTLHWLQPKHNHLTLMNPVLTYVTLGTVLFCSGSRGQRETSLCLDKRVSFPTVALCRTLPRAEVEGSATNLVSRTALLQDPPFCQRQERSPHSQSPQTNNSLQIEPLRTQSNWIDL